MFRIAVLEDCDEQIVSAFRSAGKICHIPAPINLDASSHDVCILDWRQQGLHLAAVIESGKAASDENRGWRAFAVERCYKRIVRVPLRNFQGKIYALLVVVSDISDRVLAERNLKSRNLMLRRVTEAKLNAEQHRKIAEQAVAAKNKFLAAASHDLRQPLHALGLFLAVLERRIKEEDNLAIVRKIRHSSDSLDSYSRCADIDSGCLPVSYGRGRIAGRGDRSVVG